MQTIFGISFSTLKFYLVQAHIENGQYRFDTARPFSYPFQFSFDHLFDMAHIKQIATLIKDQNGINWEQGEQLAITIPFNYATLKKVALPNDMDEALKRYQVKWNLENALTHPLDQYKIIETDAVFHYPTYSEHIFICIPQKVIKSLAHFSELLQIPIRNVILSGYAVSNILHHLKKFDNHGNQLILNLDRFAINTHLLINAAYYNSYIDKVGGIERKTLDSERLAGVIIDRYHYIQNFVQEVPLKKSDTMEVFIYGEGLSGELFKDLMNTTNFDLKPLNTKPFLGNDTLLGVSSSGIEAIGAILDKPPMGGN